MTSTTYSLITLNDLELQVTLGWPQVERLHPQTVKLDIHLHFAQPPLACVTDNIVDTYCYDALITTIKQHINGRVFHLLEYLGAEIYHAIKHSLAGEPLITIRLTKTPAIPHLQGGVTFQYGDKLHTW